MRLERKRPACNERRFDAKKLPFVRIFCEADGCSRYRAYCRRGRLRSSLLLMAEYPIFEQDVLVIGAGGAGLRAAIEASSSGVSVGLVCKSLLGKAHTVMAEGGMAAAIGNVDDRDNWKVHFSDTMRGGQYVNNWRMAELHAKEAPDRVRELEAWGAVFDRTKDGKILQRNFGGHKYPRLAHVGDRTGLGNDPHAARSRHTSGHRSLYGSYRDRLA